MAVVTFQRPPRRPSPPLPDGEVRILPPPSAPVRAPERPALWLVIPALIAALSAMMLLLTAAGGSALQVAAGALFGVSTLALAGWYLWVLSVDRHGRIDGRRGAYFRHLADVRRQSRHAATAQTAAQVWVHPDPRALTSLIRTSRLWERRRTDADFAVVRLGLGAQPLAVDLHPTATTGRPGAVENSEVDAVSATALRTLLRVQRMVPGLPVAVPLASFARVRLEGDQHACRRLAAAAVLQAVSWHAPADLRLALCVDEHGMSAWDWLKWVPHLADPSVPPTDLPRFAVAGDLRGVELLLEEELAGRPWAGAGDDRPSRGQHILVVVDGGTASGKRLADADGLRGVTVIDVRDSLAGPAVARHLRLRVTVNDLLAVTLDGSGRERVTHLGVPDQVSPAEAAAAARGMAATRLVDSDADHPLWPTTSLAEVIGVADPRALRTSTLWRPRADRDRLRVAIGIDMTGHAVDIDIKDVARGGMGPHGLVVGAPGAGKSELLRALVLGLAITHPSDYLNFLLVDVRGGGSFGRLGELPHTAAVISGLTDQIDIVDRLAAAIGGELQRRRELLGTSGPLRAPRPAHAADIEPPAEPDLLIVVDDVAPVLTGYPTLLELLTEIGTDGGPLGVHLLLAGEDLTASELGGLDDLLTYRIALRTGSVEQSRDVIGTGGAFHLPTRPGVGYLSTADDHLVRFTGAAVSAPLRSSAGSGAPRGWVDPQSFRLSIGQVGDPAEAQSASTQTPTAGPHRTLLDVAVSQLTGSGIPAHEIWLPPLAEPPTLDLLLPRASVLASGTASEAGSLVAVRGSAFLKIPLGWIDRPAAQSRAMLTLDLAGGAGTVAVVGAGGSGKSTALRSLICAVALSHSPRQVQIYGLDFGDGDLQSVAGLPQVGGVADRRDPERVRRTVAMLTRIMVGREGFAAAAAAAAAIATTRADSVDGAATAAPPPDEFGDILAVIDGLDRFLIAFPALRAPLIALMSRGRQYGIHLAVSSDDVPQPFESEIGTLIELRLADPQRSRIDPVLAGRVPADRPGRGLTDTGLHLLTALPRIDGRGTVDGLARATADLVRTVADRWRGHAAPPVKVLPAVVRAADLPADLDPGLGYPIGLDEDLEPVVWNPRTDQHLMVFGGRRSGKSLVLRRLVEQISLRHDLGEARFILLDPRRQLVDVAYRPNQVIAAAADAREAADLVTAVCGRLRTRLPAPSMTWEEIARRAWWGSTAAIYLVIDDYDRLAPELPMADAVEELLPLIGRAVDVALHVIVARTSQGASRAMTEPVYTTLKDVGAPALVLSGPDAEGTIYGRTRVTSRPPGRGIWVPRRGPDVLMQAILDPQEW